MDKRIVTLAEGAETIIVAFGENGDASIESTLHLEEAEYKDHYTYGSFITYNAMIDALESVILAHACTGVDIESKAYICAVS